MQARIAFGRLTAARTRRAAKAVGHRPTSLIPQRFGPLTIHGFVESPRHPMLATRMRTNRPPWWWEWRAITYPAPLLVGIVPGFWAS